MSADNSDILQMAAEAKEENLALQAICAGLIGEIALLSKDPQAKLRHMTASLMGMADGVARATDSKHLTRTIERVCAMAEAVLTPLPDGHK